MPDRLTTSEFQPSPPIDRLRTANPGVPSNGMAIVSGSPTRAMNPGPNMGTAPASGTNGKSVRPKIA